MTDGALPDNIVRYQQLVAVYEALDKQIDVLLASYKGRLDKMEGADKQNYRDMFRQRDEVLNEMRVLEQDLFDGDES
jgi:hypothetical protein